LIAGTVEVGDAAVEVDDKEIEAVLEVAVEVPGAVLVVETMVPSR
jgi:hypothetical protein